jgi:hypothetical protein
MSFSASDYIECVAGLDHLLPALSPQMAADLEIPLDPNNRTGDEELRALAERTCHAIEAYSEFRAVLLRLKEKAGEQWVRDLANATLEGNT